MANAIKQGLEEAENIDLFEYDLVCVGSSSYSWHPPEPMTNFLKKKFDVYRQQGKVNPSAPKVPGKNALIFITYSGPHTGISEAIPAGKDIGQYFEHLGFTVIDEWYVLSELHGSLELSTKGRMGDIRGKPTLDDLQQIKEKTKLLASKL